MRFGFKAKEAVAVTLLTFLVVATTTVVHLSRLSRVVVQEADRQAGLIAKQIYALSGRALSRVRSGSPREALTRDPELRSLLDASVGYSPHVVYALIADASGTVIVHSEREKEGWEIPARPTLDGLLSLDPVRRFWALTRGGAIYESVFPVKLDGRPFGSIRLGMTTGLLSRELMAALKQSMALAGVALPVAWLVAMGLAHLLLKPIRTLTLEMDRLRRGEFEVGTRLPREDELGELAAQVQLLGRQFQSDRLKLLSEKAQLQHMVDHLEDAVVFLNQERRILFFNRAAEGIVKRPLEEVVGWSLEDLLKPSHPLRGWLEDAFEQRVGLRNVVITLPSDDGFRDFLVSVFFLGDARQAMGAVVLLKDLESVKAVQSLISYSAKLAALGGLTSGVAHEVKNPLNAMMIHLELLKERLEPASEEVQQSLEVIGSEIRRLDRAVQGFLKFIRPQELTLKAVDVNTLLKNVAALLEAEWQKEGVRFAFRLDPALPSVTADEELLHHAFLNIMLNGCQAMPKGGKVTIGTERERPEVVSVKIADEGAGIPAEDLDKIFKLYYTTKPEGSGIGLSMVYRIVQMHDGDIDVKSEVNRGTIMTVRLPVTRAGG